MYHLIEQKLQTGAVIILDGGTGTSLEQRGVPMSNEVWCAQANLSHPEVVRAVHADYIRAGAQVITANTFATSPLIFDFHGRAAEIAAIDRIAINLAREARNQTASGPVAIAGSFSTMRPITPDSDRTQTQHEWTPEAARDLMRRKAEGLAEARCDLILMEMMRDLDYSLMAVEAATATGLPVWVGIAVERNADGELVGFGRNDWRLRDIVSALMSTGAKVCSVMHTSPNNTAEALDIVKERWNGPLGAYPESGFFKMPGWQFVDVVSPDDLVGFARAWQRKGVTLFGGCCGIGPDHIKALAKALPPHGEARR